MKQFTWWIIEKKTHLEILDILKFNKESKPWVNYFTHESPMSPGNLNSQCRVGDVPFSNCKQYRFYYLDQSREIESIAAGGICTEIYWDSKTENLPEGWQGSVKRAYDDSKSDKNKPNTIVALLAFTLSRYRKKGFSGKVISKMCLYGQENGYDYCIIPTLPPTQFQEPYINLSLDEIAKLKREDGNYYDYWLRLHTNKGASIVGTNEQSHRFALSLDNFSKYVSTYVIQTTGEHVVRLDKDQSLGQNGKNMWQTVYADIERDIVYFNWGCIWVRYDLKNLIFEL